MNPNKDWDICPKCGIGILHQKEIQNQVMYQCGNCEAVFPNKLEKRL